jgi:hypothetical protein
VQILTTIQSQIQNNSLFVQLDAQICQESVVQMGVLTAALLSSSEKLNATLSLPTSQMMIVSQEELRNNYSALSLTLDQSMSNLMRVGMVIYMLTTSLIRTS